MTDAEIINSIKDLQAAAPTMGISALPFIVLEREVNNLINRAAHYKALYEAVCAKYGAEEDLPQSEGE